MATHRRSTSRGGVVDRDRPTGRSDDRHRDARLPHCPRTTCGRPPITSCSERDRARRSHGDRQREARHRRGPAPIPTMRRCSAARCRRRVRRRRPGARRSIAVGAAMRALSRETSARVAAVAARRRDVGRLSRATADGVDATMRRCAPLAEQKTDPQLAGESVQCASCHVRAWMRRGPPGVAPSLATLPNYPFTPSPTLYERADLCMTCHQLPAAPSPASRCSTPKKSGSKARTCGAASSAELPHAEPRAQVARRARSATLRQAYRLTRAARAASEKMIRVDAELATSAPGTICRRPRRRRYLVVELLDGTRTVGRFAQRIGATSTGTAAGTSAAHAHRAGRLSMKLARIWHVHATAARVTVEAHPDEYYEGLYASRLGANPFYAAALQRRADRTTSPRRARSLSRKVRTCEDCAPRRDRRLLFARPRASRHAGRIRHAARRVARRRSVAQWSFEKKQSEFHGGGFDRLLSQGTWHVGHHPSAATLTAPGHALLGTGEPTSAPAFWRTSGGIPSSESVAQGRSARRLGQRRMARAPALGDAIAAANAGAKAVSVSLKIARGAAARPSRHADLARRDLAHVGHAGQQPRWSSTGTHACAGAERPVDAARRREARAALRRARRSRRRSRRARLRQDVPARSRGDQDPAMAISRCRRATRCSTPHSPRSRASSSAPTSRPTCSC